MSQTQQAALIAALKSTFSRSIGGNMTAVFEDALDREGLTARSAARHPAPFLPPTNDRAEMSVLGALLVNNQNYVRVSSILDPGYFADPVHSVIYKAIARRIEAGQVADAVTLGAEFEHTGQLEEVGGTAYLAQLASSDRLFAPLVKYARAVRDTWARRVAIAVAHDLVQDAFDQALDQPAEEMIDKAIRGLVQARLVLPTDPFPFTDPADTNAGTAPDGAV